MRQNLQIKAWMLLLLFLSEIFSPMHLMALGSGPSQPEMASFTPAGTTEMVDPFSGDFSYNIPLMDVEGYPINIAYNSGVTMEQEASWVGLGWNLNVGTVNRSVRGLPDDFKGDKVKTTVAMKPMVMTKFGLGTGIELIGISAKGNIPDAVKKKAKVAAGLNLGISLIHNNYKGVGIALDAGLSPSVGVSGMGFSGGVGFSLNSLDGTSVNASFGVSVDKGMNKQQSLSFGGSLGTGYNTRTGQKMLSLGTTAGYKQRKGLEPNGSVSRGGSATFLPIGMESFTPSPTLRMQSTSSSFSANLGVELPNGSEPSVNFHGSKTTQSLLQDVYDKDSYGYLYSEEATEAALKDFNREKDVALNKTTTNLSPINFTYDVYSVSGQGVSGTFRPFRNDIGTLSDEQFIADDPTSSNSTGIEGGYGSIFHFGFNLNDMESKSEYGPWNGGAHSNYKFRANEVNSSFENVYFKAAGELTESDQAYFDQLQGKEAVAFQLNKMNTEASLLVTNKTENKEPFQARNITNRVPRAKLFHFLNAEDAKHVGLMSNIESYKKINSLTGEGHFYKGSIGIEHSFERTDATDPTNLRKAHHISEVTQVNPDGERYVFGIPAYNWVKEDVSYNTEQVEPNPQLTDNTNKFGRVAHDQAEDGKDANKGKDWFYNKTETDPYAHSFLLTAKQSVDYQDITGDGVTPDDAGNAWKFNYTRTSGNYKWRSPYADVNYQEGFRTIPDDQKANYSYGEKELWYVHSIESKNQVAEFHLEERKDALGAKDRTGGKPSSISNEDRSFRLKKIVLFNKYDRLYKRSAAVPIKTVEFEYDYSLCEGVENWADITSQSGVGQGKLTLKKIKISYANSGRGTESPYVFTYSTTNPDYNPTEVDRWGNYKMQEVNPGNLENKDFPYSTQEKVSSLKDPDKWASAWSLTSIKLPSGGDINVTYEADDYAYVQHKEAMEMFPVLGAGNSFVYGTGDRLYENDKLYIKRPSNVSKDAISDDELKRRLLGEKRRIDNMYFKFLTEIRPTKFEYVSGYVSAIDAGYCTDRNYLWIQLAPSSTNKISETAWGYFRENLFDVLYDNPSTGDGNVENIVRGLVSNINDIKQMLDGVAKTMRGKKVADEFIPNQSFIRLNAAAKFKKGGGSRVKRIEQNDNWSSMAQEGTNATYGQDYSYTTKDEYGITISSGVATYEPMVGNDENPWKTPVPYVSVGSSGRIPAIDAYQETPFGESFFPSASVGYSQVSVKNTHANTGATANQITDHLFYTAKDFPVEVRQTDLNGTQKYVNPAKGPGLSFPFVDQTQRNEFAASQGYSILLNDMHGKPRKTESYVMMDSNGSKAKKINSGTLYNYHVENSPKGMVLTNEVDVLTSDGYVKKKLMGVEVDIAIDSRRSYESTSTKSRKRGLDVLPGIGVIPFFPIPNIWENTLTNIKETRTAVVTKVVQQYGIIESVYNYTDQYATTAYNRLYNGQTGEVLLTETEDEHRVKEFQFTVPAYLVDGLDRMSGAYKNHEYKAQLESETLTPCLGGVDGYFKNPGKLRHGDEVLVHSTSGGTQRAWVDLNFPVPNYGENFKDPIIEGKEDCGEYVFTMTAVLYTNDGNLNFCDKITSANIGPPVDALVLREMHESATIYPLKGNISNFFDVPYLNSNNLLEPYETGINQTFCDEFSVINNTTTIYAVNNTYHVGAVQQFGIWAANVNSFALDQLFDFNDPISLEHYIASGNLVPAPSTGTFSFDLTEDTDSRLVNGIIDPIRVKGKKRHYLLKNTYDDGGSIEDIYFVVSLERAGPIIKLPGDLFVNGESPCPLTFRLIDRKGDVITGLSAGDELTVIRSAYRNMLTASTGAIVSKNSSPIDVDDMTGEFIGVKANNEVGILQANAQVFSEDYVSEDLNASVAPKTASSLPQVYNKFLTGSDGKFRQNKTYRYEASRSQSNELETAQDGHYVANDTWQRIEKECYLNFQLNQPSSFETETSNPSGWFIQEEITDYELSGIATGATNALGIRSAVLTNQTGQVEAVVSNTTKNEIAVESFENYQYLSPRDRAWTPHFNLFKEYVESYIIDDWGVSGIPLYLNLLQNNISYTDGIAHSGEHSLYLKGKYNGTYPMTINYTENNLNGLVGVELEGVLGAIPQSKSWTQTEYDAEKQQHINAFEVAHGQAAPNETHAMLSKMSKTYASGEAQGFSPTPGKKYHFSVWVKEVLASGTPYQGVSPSVHFSSQGGSAALNTEFKQAVSPLIDGWYKIEGEFIYPADATALNIELSAGPWGTFFDDLRIHPSESNLNTYVYNRRTGKVEAKLDENNYATFYEYNLQGIPSQVKRETAKGILTVSESRQSTHNH